MAVMAAAALLGCTPASTGDRGGKDKDKDKKAGKDRREKSRNALEDGVPVANPGVAEPSGIAFHPRLRRLFVVGDEGTLAELDADGAFVRARPLGANLEDVAVHDPTGLLVLLDEVRAALLVYDPAAGAVRGRWRLDTSALVGRGQRGRDGFEGLAFRPEAGRPGGGVFYLAHQRQPAMVVAFSFDPAGPAGEIGAAAVAGRWAVQGQSDLTALSWSPALGRLLLLADAEDELLVMTTEGAIEKRLRVPGVQQEGVCLDDVGGLWVADDRGGRVVRYLGARPAIEAAPTPAS